MSDYIFCRIVAGEAPASFVHRDELISAVLDIRPITPGHLLVILNEHVVVTSRALPVMASSSMRRPGANRSRAARSSTFGPPAFVR